MNKLLEQRMTKEEIYEYVDLLLKKEAHELTGSEASFLAKWCEIIVKIDEADKLLDSAKAEMDALVTTIQKMQHEIEVMQFVEQRVKEKK